MAARSSTKKSPPRIHCNDPDAYSALYLVIGTGTSEMCRHYGSGIFRNEDSMFAKSFCGIASWRCSIDNPDLPAGYEYREGTTIPFSEFRCMPATAQCGHCARRATAMVAKHEPLGLHGIGSSLIPPRAATEEMTITVEAFLHWVVRLFGHDFSCLEEIPLYRYVG